MVLWEQLKFSVPEVKVYAGGTIIGHTATKSNSWFR